MESNLIDHVRVFCASGAGGNGASHLHRARFLPKGRPDGGEGGLGNDRFKSAANKTPKEFTSSEPGREGRFIFKSYNQLTDINLSGNHEKSDIRTRTWVRCSLHNH